MNLGQDDEAPEDRTDSSGSWALTAQLPPEPGQPTSTLMVVRRLEPTEFAEVEAANALLRRFTGGSAYQRLHQAFRLVAQHAEQAHTRAARIPQPSLQRETARLDDAIGSTLEAADALLGSLVNDIATQYGQQSQQATSMREVVEQARGNLPVALSEPLLALANAEPSLVEIRNLSGDDGPPEGKDVGQSGEPIWEPVLRESVLIGLVAAVGPTAAPLSGGPVRIVPLLEELVLACQRLFARHLLFLEERIAAASLLLRRLTAEVLDGAPILMLTSGDPHQPQISFRELALDEIRLLQRALRQARRLLAPAVTPPTRPPTAPPEGSTTALPTTEQVEEKEKDSPDHPSTGDSASSGEDEIKGATTASAVDLLAIVEHAGRLTVTAERVWSSALNPTALSEANQELLDEWANLIAVVQRQAELSSRALQDAGLDATADQFPPNVTQLLALDLDANTERRRRQLQLAQFYALDQLVAALQGLRHPSRAALDPRTGQITQTWWESGAFALVRARAWHLSRVTLALLSAEHAAIAAASDEAETTSEQAIAPAQPPPWWAHLQLAAEALRRGDIEATLLHGYLALTAHFPNAPSLSEAAAAPFADEAAGEAAKTLVAKLEEAIQRLAAGADVDLGVTVPLAHALPPFIEQLLLPIPMATTPRPPDAPAEDHPDSATTPDRPSNADPPAPQAGP